MQGGLRPDHADPWDWLPAYLEAVPDYGDELVHICPIGRFIYVETPKCACTSLKAIIREACGESEAGTESSHVHDRDGSPLLKPSAYLAEMSRLSGQARPWIFAVVRDPTVRLIAAYLDKIARPSLRRGVRLAGLGFAPTARPSFAEFVEAIARAPRGSLDTHWRPQQLLLQPGIVPYDLVGRLEDAENVFDLINHAIDRGDGASNPTCLGAVTGASDRRAELLDARTRALIRDVYQSDFASFAYAEP